VKGPDSGDVKRVLELFGGEFAHPQPRVAAGVVDEDIGGAKRRSTTSKPVATAALSAMTAVRDMPTRRPPAATSWGASQAV